jgi:large subunit ribosomal protein L19
MNTSRLKKLADQRHYHLLPVKTGYQIEIQERVGEGNNQRIWKFKWLVIKVKKPNHADGTFTIRGKTAGMTIEKIYPLSFPSFEKVTLIDVYKLRQARIYYIRDKVGKGARMKSISTAEQRGVDLLIVAKDSLQERLGLIDEPNNWADIEESIADNIADESTTENVVIATEERDTENATAEETPTEVATDTTSEEITQA